MTNRIQVISTVAQFRSICAMSTPDHVVSQYPQFKRQLRRCKDPDVLREALSVLFQQDIAYSFSHVLKDFINFIDKETQLRVADILMAVIDNTNNNVAYISEFVRQGVDIDAAQKTERGNMPPLMFALQRRNVRAVDQILKHWPNPYEKSVFGSPAKPQFALSRRLLDDMSMYKKMYDKRLELVKNDRPKINLNKADKGYVQFRENGSLQSFSTGYYTALSGQFFDYIKQPIKRKSHRNLEIWADDLCGTQYQGLTVADALFYRLLPEEVFDSKHWEKHEDRLDAFFKHLPKIHQRKCQKHYLECKRDIQKSHLKPDQNAPKIKRRRPPKRMPWFR